MTIASSATCQSVIRRRTGTPTGSAFRLQAEADAADGVDQRPPERPLELAPQVADVDVDDIGRPLEVLVPDVVEQRRAADHLARPPGEVLEDRELPRGERDRLP